MGGGGHGAFGALLSNILWRGPEYLLQSISPLECFFILFYNAIGTTKHI